MLMFSKNRMTIKVLMETLRKNMLKFIKAMGGDDNDNG